MANQEGVEIIIKATDQYSSTIKKIEASNQLFGQSIKNIEKEIAALETYMVKLVTAGIKPTSGAIKILQMNLDSLKTTLTATQNAAKGADSAIGASAGNLKKSNQAYTNLALVVQDLPYGFRGIQNNLPALMGSVAGATGPMYLAFSALIAAVTAYDAGLFKAKESNDEFNKSLSKTNEELRKAIDYTNADGQNLESLIRVGLNLNNSESVRLNALKDIKKALAQVNKEEAAKITTVEGAIIPVQQYTEALKKQQLQEYASGKIAELQIGLVEKRNALAIAQKGGERSISILKLFGIDNVGELRTQVIQAETQIRFLEDILDQANKKTFVNPFDKSNKQAVDNSAIKQQQQVNEQVLQNLIDAKKQEIQMYKDDAFAKYKASAELVQLEVDLAKEKLKNAGYTAKQIAALEVGIYKERDNKLVLLGEALQEQLLTQDDKTRKEKKKRDEKDLKSLLESYKNNLSSFDDFYDNLQNLNTGNRLKQKSLYEQESSDLQYMLENNLISYDDYISRLGTVFKGWANNNKAIAAEAAGFIQQVGNGLMSALGPAMDMLIDKGANIGEVIQKMAQDLIKQLIKVIATAAIAALLMTIIFPEKLATAGMSGMDVFSGLFTQGMGLGTMAFPAKKFANGGVISGPTMGLMGEYPGAANNPEVVAPLDKLKSMIGGGGGGTFVLRGQDLLLSVNRAQKASNLKGQNISLA
jgi:hypothetical protein